MTNRREFIHYTSAVAAAASLPVPVASLAAASKRMETRPIPGTDEQLSVIGLGNSEAFQSGDVELSNQLIDIFMERGGGYVDTSGPGRFTLGQIMQQRNAYDALFLGTYLNATEKMAGLEEIMAVQDGQGGGALDLLLTRNVVDFAAHASRYHEWKQEGLARYVGVARPNQRYYEGIMKMMQDRIVDFVQINYSMLEPEAAERLLPMAMDKGIAVVINRPFINGEYFSVVKGHDLPDWAAEFDCETWAQFSLKYIISHPAVNCVLTETSNPEHAIDNLGAGVGRLPDDTTRARMLALMQGMA